MLLALLLCDLWSALIYQTYERYSIFSHPNSAYFQKGVWNVDMENPYSLEDHSHRCNNLWQPHIFDPWYKMHGVSQFRQSPVCGWMPCLAKIAIEAWLLLWEQNMTSYRLALEELQRVCCLIKPSNSRVCKGCCCFRCTRWT